MRGEDGITSDLDGLPMTLKQNVHRVFLADGNALAMSTQEMVKVLSTLRENLPALERVGTYAYAKDVRDKSVEDLTRLREAGLGIVYLGLETGDDDLLRWCRKGVDSKEMIEACLKIRDAGIKLSLTIILGLGGLEHSKQHAIATAKALNEIDPEYVGALTLMIPRGTPLFDMTQRGEFEPMRPFDILKELRILVEGLELTNCVFRTNHASNYIPLGGTLNSDKERILKTLDTVIDEHDESMLRPHGLRGL